MDYDKCRDGEACRGVIKKLFPSKRYGFAVCECIKHTGEAHFNYSDLDLPEQERSCLLVGWRIEFYVIEQHKKTDHCDYRATRVKPVSVMVVQCEFSDLWDKDTAALVCKELANKIIYVTKDKYNGKFESDAIARRDTCRAAVTWEEIKQRKTVAIHCSQDTISPSTGSPYRPKFKTPEKRTRRDCHSFSESTIATSDDVFKPSVCDQINQTFTRGHDSGLVSPDDQQCLTSSRGLGTPLVRVLRTSTPRTERFARNHDGSSRLLSMLKMSPSQSCCNNSSCGSNTNGSNSCLSSNTSGIVVNNGNTNGNSGNDAATLLHEYASDENVFRDGQITAPRRNLDREYELYSSQSQENKKVAASSPKNSFFLGSTKIMSLLSLREENGLNESHDISTENSNQRGYRMDSVFGLYDANRANDEMNIYAPRNQSANASSFKSSWESSQSMLTSPTSCEQQLQLQIENNRETNRQQRVDSLYRQTGDSFFGEAGLPSVSNFEKKSSR